MTLKPTNTISLWFNKDAQDATRFYAATFPNSEVTAVHKAPGDYPSGKEGDVLTVKFKVLGIPCLGLNGGPEFKHSEAPFPSRSRRTIRKRRTVTGTRSSATAARKVRAVGARTAGASLGADHPARSNRGTCGWWRRGKACLRGNDADEKDQHRQRLGCETVQDCF
jgi:hypothetical protein